MALLDGLGKVGVWVPGHELVGINALTGQQLLDVQAQVQLLPPGQGRRGDLMMAQLVQGGTVGVSKGPLDLRDRAVTQGLPPLWDSSGSGLAAGAGVLGPKRPCILPSHCTDLDAALPSFTAQKALCSY